MEPDWYVALGVLIAVMVAAITVMLAGVLFADTVEPVPPSPPVLPGCVCSDGAP